ncbi:MAG: TetR/AcrR family transcriptional regulator [Bacteroides sp.]
MNNKFFDLPQEKQNTIINAALHVFAKYDYKKASTDEITSLAGISKGLLFHYFENKKGLYLFLYKYAISFFIKEMSSMHDYTETDFFKILVNAQMCKLAVLSKHPDIMLFIVQVYYEESPVVKDEIDKGFSAIIADSSRRFLERADTSKLKDGVSAEKLLNIILWMSEGFMRTRTPMQLADLPKLNEEYLEHIEMIRKQVYKPEFI